MLVELFHARFDPARADEREAASATARVEQAIDDGREPRPGPHPAQLPRRHPGDAAHQLLPARRQRLQALPVVQARPLATALAAAAAPAVRDLRLLAARRGRAPARRQGGSRRAALVGPPGGLPHGGPRADEGADGQERRDRAGGRQGRLRRQAPAALTPGPARGGAGVLPDVHPRPARRHRQHPRRRGRSPAAGRALRRGRPLPRGRRRQRHGHLLRRSRTRSPASTASGWATPSPRAARAATTTRRWASPPAAPGSRSSATSASSATTSRPRTSPSSGSATCRATCSATGCCSPATSASSAPSTTATSSSTPIPTRRARFEERKRLFELPRSSWADYDMSLVSKGGGVFPRSAKSIPLSKEIRDAPGRRGGGDDAARADPRRCCARPWTCSGTAASAPT